MRSPFPLSRPGPLSLVEATPQYLTTEIEPCYICYYHSFGRRTASLQSSESPWSNLVTSARRCNCCSAIVRGCRGWLDDDGKKEWIPNKIILEFTNISHSDEDTSPRWFHGGIDEICIHFAATTPIRLEIFASSAESTDTEIWPPKTWKHLEQSRRTVDFTGSERAVQVVKTWLRDCLGSHVNCPNDHDQHLPTRLLDLEVLEDTEDLKLIETNGELGRYAALSHCWGATQQFTTTIATFPERRERIPFKKLTETFKEAVKTTRALGIRYLWIDSLCIIQGDTDDWAREASQMSSVYQKALITIAAASSESGDKGLFRQRLDPEHKVDVQWTSVEPFSLIFRRRFMHLDTNLTEYHVDFPLATRAWAFQERFLSPRVLHYTSKELFFECIQEARCECNDINQESWDLKIRPLRADLHFPNIMSSMKLHETWRSIVEHYSNLQLTYTSDKLVAIGGLARRFARDDDDYLAGIWRNTLIQDLQWVRNPRKEPRRRRPTWRAPSWSWAAIDSQISHFGHNNPLEPIIYVEHTDFVDCTIVPKGPDMYGELLSARIKLNGPCISAMLGLPPNHQIPTLHPMLFPNGRGAMPILDLLLPDMSMPIEATCLLLSERITIPGQRMLIFLVLRRLEPGQDVFERIGLCSVYGHVVQGLIPAEKTAVEIV